MIKEKSLKKFVKICPNCGGGNVSSNPVQYLNPNASKCNDCGYQGLFTEVEEKNLNKFARLIRNKEKTKLNRKAQEEMVGFVLIVVLLVIISLVFLSFALRKKSPVETSTEVDNLLSAMLAYTTDCALYLPQYETLGDLIKSCYYNEKCSDGKETCKVLKETMSEMLKAAEGDLKGDRPIKSYEMNASYSAKQEGLILKKTEDSILYIKQGICTANSIGAQQFIPLDTGNIILTLKFCY